jgi:hypothetical protein
MPIGDVHFASFLGRFIADGAFREQVLADPNGALKAAGVELDSSVKVDAAYKEANSKGQLDVTVYNAGADWTGVLNLKLKK